LKLACCGLTEDDERRLCADWDLWSSLRFGVQHG